MAHKSERNDTNSFRDPLVDDETAPQLSAEFRWYEKALGDNSHDDD